MAESDAEIMDELTAVLARNVFKAGGGEVNFLILQKLPTNVKDLMEILNLTKVPVNGHVNKLEKMGLLTRRLGTGEVFPTEITKCFLKMHENMKKIVGKNMVCIFSKSIK